MHGCYTRVRRGEARRLSRGFQTNGSYQFASEYGPANLGKHYGRVLNPSATVRHAIKMQWDYSVPVGRGRRFGASLPGWLDGAPGGWELNGVGRIQARTLTFGNVRLIGMTPDELRRRYYYPSATSSILGRGSDS